MLSLVRVRKLSRALSFVGVVLFALPLYSYAAELSLSPASGSYAVGKEFSIKVQVKPGGTESVNAADGSMTFDKDRFSVVKISKDPSQFSLWTSDPTFSNSAGTIEFSGGTPTAFANTGTAITITFKAKKEGEGKVAFSKGSILAADGKGTNVYTKGSEGTFTITPAVAAPPPPVPSASDDIASLPNGPVPLAPLINSPTHGKPELWYATTTAEFSWKFGNDEIVGIRTLLSQEATATPKTILPAASTSEVLNGIAEGEWYYFLQFKNTSGWGEIAKKKIRIDITPPSEFDFTVSEKGADGTPAKFAFAAEDALSGMDRYEIVVKDTVIATVRAQDMSNGTTPVPVQEGGQQTVTIRAYDKAGNMREVKKEVTLPAVAKGGKAVEEVPIQSTFTWERILLVLFALITGVIITMMRNLKKKVQADHSVVLQGVLAVREKNDRTFQAMREEFEEMIQNLDPKPQLTAEEREFTERMKEVLEIAQGFIDTGIEDLKKTVRGQ